jgi:hypothetical protein
MTTGSRLENDSVRKKMKRTIGSKAFTASLEDTTAAAKLNTA